MTDTVEVTVTLPRSLVAAAGVREQDLDRVLREALALELYRGGQLSLGKAAEVAGVPTKWEMMSVLAKHDIWLDFTAEDAFRDADTVVEALKQ